MNFLQSRFDQRTRGLALTTFLALTLEGCSWVELVSVDGTGTTGNGDSQSPVLSADGRYTAFYSYANNLVPGDSGYSDVFVHDALDNITTLVSVNSAGDKGNNYSYWPHISANGRYVSFYSQADNLVENDGNNSSDVFVHDRDTGITTRVSVDSLGNEGSFSDSGSFAHSMSEDGRYIAFCSASTDLVPDDTNNAWDIFLHDRNTGATSRVSVDSTGAQANGINANPKISGDGRYITYYSNASNLVANDTNGLSDVFVHDRITGVTTRVSVDSAGTEGNDASLVPFPSRDGRYIAFLSYATNLVPGDTNTKTDVFVHDRNTVTTSRVSIDSAGSQANGTSFMTSISPDGRYVAFSSVANNLVNADTNGKRDIFIHDLDTAMTFRASVRRGGAELNDDSFLPTLSGDSRYVTFYTDASDLVAGDVNFKRDVAVKAITPLSIATVSPVMLPIGATTPVTITGAYFLPGSTPKVADAAFSNLVIVDENTITMDVTVGSDETAGARDVYMMLYGTGPGSLTGVSALCGQCVTFQ